MYQKELTALKKRGLLRSRNVIEGDILDFASNDYLGFASDKKLLKKTYKTLLSHNIHAPRASMLINGYSPIHQDFETQLAAQNGFEKAICVGSGFLANIALIESLVREGDMLYIDAEYHASGMLGAKLIPERFKIFKHNDVKDLKRLLKKSTHKRIVIAVEGIYSMGGDRVDKKIISLADKYNAILIIDEAHSSGVVGKNLQGVYDFYKIKIKPTHIKMGTLGKAMGSYGAYICGSEQIISFLENRAKPIIYSTAPSLFDIEYARRAMGKIAKNKKKLYEKIQKRRRLIQTYFGTLPDGLILNIPMESSEKVMAIKKELFEMGYAVGAIRPPTVAKPILRIIARVDIPLHTIELFFILLQKRLK